MFKLFKRNETPAPAAPKVYKGPAEGAYVIGDVHGCFDKMVALLGLIKADILSMAPNVISLDREARPKLVFLGDLIDRGPQSREVLAGLLKYQPDYADPIFLMGNHEEVFLKVLEGDVESLRFWYKFGGRECMQSYGVDNLGEIQINPENLLYRFQESVPQSHIDFVSSFKDYYIAKDYLCVHAGIQPKVPLSEQRPKDMRWIREAFLRHTKPHEYRVIHGHTISEEPEDLPNRIGIDTGVYNGNPLSAVFIKEDEVRFIQAK